MIANWGLWWAGGLLAFGCWAAATARALREFSRHGLEELGQSAPQRLRLGEILLRHGEAALVADSLRVFASAGATICVLLWSQQQPEPLAPALVALFACVWALIISVAVVALPHALVRLWADPLIYYTWPIWKLGMRVMAPLVWAGKFCDLVLHRLAGRAPAQGSQESFNEEIRTIVTEGHREGLLEEEEREMIEAVIELADAVVREIMTPRTEMVTLSVATTLDEALKFVTGAGHSRVPLYDKNRDDIAGVLHVKDLLGEAAKPPSERTRTLAELMRKPFFVPETKPIDALLQEFQKKRNHIAIVLDEYGGVAGLVTIEDVLEEIVGEIADEHDDELVEGVKRIDERTAEVLARIRVEEINERLNLELPDEADFDTIGGLVISRLGRIPTQGESLTEGRVRLTVLEASRRRVERLRVELLDEQPAEASS